MSFHRGSPYSYIYHVEDEQYAAVLRHTDMNNRDQLVAGLAAEQDE
jgi:hypothetical protein